MNVNLWKPLTEENIINPYGMYETLRRTDPVHRAQTGEYIIDVTGVTFYDLPEPGAMALLAIAAGCAARRRRR